MKRIIVTCLLLWPLLATAELGGPSLESPGNDVYDTESLRRGAKLYVDRCLGCHSLKHMRYRRLQKDLGFSEAEIKQLFPTLERVVGSMTTAMDSKDSERWFGVAAPDLSERARALGTDWLYTYLRTFYVDDERPFGVNNWVFKDVAMPHVFWDLQGEQRAVIKKIDEMPVIVRLEQAKPGKLSAKEFDLAVTDLVNFLDYVAEPAQLERRSLGKWVLLFLLIFGFVSYKLKKEYWKDIH